MSRMKILLIIILVGVASLLVISFGRFFVSAKGDIIVSLRDEETGKPIGRVNGGYVRVMLGGVDQGYLTDKGEMKIEGVDPGTHELVLIIPHYGEKRQFVEVGPGQTVTANITVDMPNPVFQVSIDCNTHLEGFDEVGDIYVTLTNFGDIDSRSTSVLVLVYREDDLSMPIATHMLDFPSLVPRKDGGESETLTWKCKAFVWGPKEIIVTVIFEGWPFTPQNEQVASQISAPSSIIAELTYSVTNYLKQHPEVIVNTIARIIIGWFG